MKRNSYEFTVLRYRHDVWTDESMNIGVLLFCPSQHYLELKVRTAKGRIGQAYPDMDFKAFRSFVQALERRFSGALDAYGFLPRPENALEFAKNLLPSDDSSFAWSQLSSGLAEDAEAKHEQLYQRLVARYYARPIRAPRTDEDVFESLKPALKKAKPNKRFETHTVVSEYAKVTFSHSLKNGVWHCVQPVSLNSANEDRMVGKAAQ